MGVGTILGARHRHSRPAVHRAVLRCHRDRLRHTRHLRVTGAGLEPPPLAMGELHGDLSRPHRPGRVHRAGVRPHGRLRRHRLGAVADHRLPDGLFRDPLGRPAQGAVPRVAHRPVLGQLHDADAGVDRPPADRRLRQQGAHGPAPDEPAGELAGWQGLDGDPRSRLRLHPLPDPRALRRARQDRPATPGGRPRSRPQPLAHLHTHHPASQPADDHDRDAGDGVADDGRLLHQPAPGGHAADGHDRQPDRRPALDARACCRRGAPSRCFWSSC